MTFAPFFLAGHSNLSHIMFYVSLVLGFICHVATSMVEGWGRLLLGVASVRRGDSCGDFMPRFNLRQRNSFAPNTLLGGATHSSEIRRHFHRLCVRCSC